MKRRGNSKRRIMILLVAIFLITFGSVVFGSSFSSAHDRVTLGQESYKYYKSIEIEAGDSLWSIADEYKAYDEDIQAYIEELYELNGLTSDTIHQGQHLIVAYYDVMYR